MSEFIGSNGKLTFERGIVRAIRQEAPEDVLAESERLATKQRVIGVAIQKKTLFLGGYVALIVNPNETEYKIKSSLDCPTNLVLIDNSDQLQAAQPVVAEIQAAIASGQEIYFVNLDPSELPAPQLERHTASPEWEGLASEIRNTLLGTNKDAYSFFISSVATPEFPEGLGFQGLFPKPNKAYLEVFASENPPFNQSILSALEKAGWASPSDATPNFSKTVHWSDDEADNVANFLANTLQWCLFLDATTVRISHEITQDR
jgi:hypothetical protein